MSPTKEKIMATIWVAVSLLNTARTTVRPIDQDEQSTYAQKIEVGEKVRLHLDERVKEIRVTEVSDQAITGKPESGGVVIADWRDIYEVERVEISPIKTAGAVVGIIIAIPVVALFALMSGCTTTYC